MKTTVITSAIGAMLLCLASCTLENDARVASPFAGSGEKAQITLTSDITDISRTMLDGTTDDGVKFTAGDAIGV